MSLTSMFPMGDYTLGSSLASAFPEPDQASSPTKEPDTCPTCKAFLKATDDPFHLERCYFRNNVHLIVPNEEVVQHSPDLPAAKRLKAEPNLQKSNDLICSVLGTLSSVELSTRINLMSSLDRAIQISSGEDQKHTFGFSAPPSPRSPRIRSDDHFLLKLLYTPPTNPKTAPELRKDRPTSWYAPLLASMPPVAFPSSRQNGPNAPLAIHRRPSRVGCHKSASFKSDDEGLFSIDPSNTSTNTPSSGGYLNANPLPTRSLILGILERLDLDDSICDETQSPVVPSTPSDGSQSRKRPLNSLSFNASPVDGSKFDADCTQGGSSALSSW